MNTELRLELAFENPGRECLDANDLGFERSVEHLAAKLQEPIA